MMSIVRWRNCVSVSDKFRFAISIVRRGWSKLRPRKSGCVTLNVRLEFSCGLRIEIGLSVESRVLLNVALKHRSEFRNITLKSGVADERALRRVLVGAENTDIGNGRTLVIGLAGETRLVICRGRP